MDELNGKSLPSELTELEQRLRRGRAQASGLELDELKLRAMRQARQAKPTTLPGGQLLRSRLALLTMIVAGLMMSTAGAGLAISGSSGSGSAATNNYGQVPSGGGGGKETLAGQEEGTDNGGDKPASGAGPAGADQGAQANDQTQATGGDDTLPFTGFLAIPLLIGGVALLGTGSVLRWKNRD